MRRGGKTVDGASATVYGRPDACYVTTSARATSGLWLETGAVVAVPVAAGDGRLAEAVHGAVRPDARVVRHPAQDEWTAWRRETVAPILRLARVRSWTAFLAPAVLVAVSRRGTAWRVAPERRDARRPDVFEELPGESVEILDCTVADLAPALRAALETAERADAPHVSRRRR